MAPALPANRPAVQPFHGDIEKLTEQSSDFRRVLFTGAHTQVVAMSIAAGEDIGDEVHRVDQCFFFVDGKGQGVVSGQTTKVEKDEVLCVPAGLRHNIRNTGSEPLKLYTIYSTAAASSRHRSPHQAGRSASGSQALALRVAARLAAVRGTTGRALRPHWAPRDAYFPRSRPGFQSDGGLPTRGRSTRGSSQEARPLLEYRAPGVTRCSHRQRPEVPCRRSAACRLEIREGSSG